MVYVWTTLGDVPTMGMSLDSPFKMFLVFKALHISIPKFGGFHVLFEEIIF
jgi:hypothetical protein